MRNLKPNKYWALALIGLVIFMLISARLVSSAFMVKDTTPPVITVWYGAHQSFGQPAISQRWVNILGNVADPESGIHTLRYTLNGGPAQDLHWGPDQRRLVKPGDYNIELDPASLRAGENQVVITATNGAGLSQSSTVSLTYTPSQTVLPLPYTIDWANVKNAQDVLQIVDGKWRWDASGIRTLELGYDRFLTVGDARWTNYQVTVPVTVHAIDPAGYHDKNSGAQASVAVDLHWIGHSDVPVVCPQPHCGWDPVGDFNKFFFHENNANYLAMKLLEKEQNFPTIPYTFDPGDTYIFKVRVRSVPQGNEYSMKVWEQGKQTEPAGWMFQRVIAAGNQANQNPPHGAFALVAHYTDVTFGNILVEAVK